MRRINAILSILILVLFLAHGIAGGFQVTGVYPGGLSLMTSLARGMITLVAIHAIIGVILTIQSIIAIKRAGTFYFRENKRFLASRISGLCIGIFIIFHLMIFMRSGENPFVLNPFETQQLITQILFVISIAVHILTNIRPLHIALGGKRFGNYLKDILFILSVILLFLAISFVIYYVRWNIF